MKITQPHYNDTPDGSLIYKVDKQTFKVNIFFNQNAKETLQDKLLRVILTEEQKGRVIYV